MFGLGEFKFVVATTPQQLEAAHRLRYKVFVDDYRFLKAEDNPGGLEKDEFDPYSIQFLAQDSHGRALGTVRLIQNSHLGLPVLNLCRDFYQDKFPESTKIAEISRLTLDPSLRGTLQRDYDDIGYYLKRFSLGNMSEEETKGLDKRVVVMLGLIQILTQATHALGVTDLYLVAERRLMVLLKRQGIIFHQIGPEIGYHGVRAPFLGHVSELWPITFLFRNKLAGNLERRKRPIPFRTDGSLTMGRYRFRIGRRQEDREDALALRQLTGGRLPDRFDEDAYHIIAQEESGRVAGTLRLIPNSARGLPSFALANYHFAAAHQGSKRLGEISGLTLAATVQYGRAGKQSAVVLAGLLRTAQELAAQLRLTGILAFLKPELADLVDRLGLPMTPVGEAMSYGRPYLVRTSAITPMEWRETRALASAVTAQPQELEPA